MAKNSYKKIISDGDKVSFFSLLFFQWMSSVFKTGNERGLEETDLLPLLKENTSCSVIGQLRQSGTKKLESSEKMVKDQNFGKAY